MNAVAFIVQLAATNDFGALIIVLVAVLIACFVFLSWISGRYWDRGIFPPFLRFRRSNYYEAVINLAVNIIRCDSGSLLEKRGELQRFVRSGFPDISGGITASYRSAEKAPVSTKSVAAWLKKHVHSEREKTELLKFLFRLAVMDGTLGKREHAILLVFVREIGLDPGLLHRIADAHNRSRAERLFDEQEQRRADQSAGSGRYDRKRAARILGLADGFTQDDVKKAYRFLAKRYHPDLYGQASEEEKSRMSQRFVEIQEAYEFLAEKR